MAAKLARSEAAALSPSVPWGITHETEERHALSNAIVAGRLTELGGPASTTCIARLIAEQQHAGEPVAWIVGAQSTVFPADLAEAGIHLANLPFLRLPEEKGAPLQRLEAAEGLLRSGAFGLVVIEVPEIAKSTPLPARALSRLHALARTHGSRVVLRCAHAARASLGPLIALRLHAARGKDGRLHLEVQKSKIGPVEVPSLPLELPVGAAPEQTELFPELPKPASLPSVKKARRPKDRALHVVPIAQMTLMDCDAMNGGASMNDASMNGASMNDAAGLGA
ncbi:MAG: hypothetical protein AAF938_01525 [Myxococcota bacterium]